jgi:hypothetical protein
LARLKPDVTNSRAEAELNAMFVSSTTSGPTALGIDRPEAVIDRALVENHALVPKTAN